jgi:hypothetical protein
VSGSTGFLIGFGLALASLGLALALLPRPLLATMTELSGTRERGELWTRLGCVALTAGVLLFALLGFWTEWANPAGGPPGPLEAFWSAASTLRWALIGLLLGCAALAGMVLASMALQVSGAVARPDAPES